jgi:hypothetical protein
MTLVGVAADKGRKRWVAYWTGPGRATHVVLPLRLAEADRETAMAAATAQGPHQGDLWLQERARGETAA